MIIITQAGQFGKTKYLFEMHKLRARVFRERLGWDVNVSPMGLETDQFDLPEAIYLLAVTDNDQVVGNWRLLPTNGPTMIRDIWPDFLNSIEMPCDPYVWETSRFAVDTPNHSGDESLFNKITLEMFCGLTEMCIICGIEYIYTLYDMKIARLLRHLNCRPEAVSEKRKIDNDYAQVGCFKPDIQMLAKLRAHMPGAKPVINPMDLPEILQNMRVSLPSPQRVVANA